MRLSMYGQRIGGSAYSRGGVSRGIGLWAARVAPTRHAIPMREVCLLRKHAHHYITHIYKRTNNTYTKHTSKTVDRSVDRSIPERERERGREFRRCLSRRGRGGLLPSQNLGTVVLPIYTTVLFCYFGLILRTWASPSASPEAMRPRSVAASPC